jgi:hypothetical protein
MLALKNKALTANEAVYLTLIVEKLLPPLA